MEMIARRRLAALAIAGVASVLLACACSDGPAIRWVSADAHVDARETAVRAPVGGLVRGPRVREGDRVVPGDVVAWIVSPTESAAVPALSPARGQIATPMLAEGELAPAGSTLATVVDMDAPEVVLEVKEADIGEVAVGQPIKVTIDALKLTILTRVATIAIRPIPSSDAPAAGKAKYEVRAPLTPVDPRLKVGMSATTRIYTSGGPGVSQ
jgi:multidrug efflux pump subunit AcrA (membrane-fusion protein)